MCSVGVKIVVELLLGNVEHRGSQVILLTENCSKLVKTNTKLTFPILLQGFARFHAGDFVNV